LDDLYHVWLKLTCWLWRRFFFSMKTHVNMLFPIKAPYDPRGPWFEQTWIYIISESFHINMSSSGSVVLEKKIFKWTTRFLYFCDYLPFEEDLSHYANKLEFALPKDHFCQVWLNLAQWFWRRRFFFNFQCVFTLFLLSPLGEGYTPSFKQTWIPSPKDDLCEV
jgi:hypothetical protein